MIANYEKELEETVAELPQQPPSETVEVLTKRKLLSAEALVYKCAWVAGVNGKKERMVRVHCTACGAVMHFPYEKLEEPRCRYGFQPHYGFQHPNFNEVVWHCQDTLCPACGASARVLNIQSFVGQHASLKCSTCVSVHNVRGHLCLLRWTIEKKTDKNGIVLHHAYREEGVIYIGKKKYRVTGFRKTGMFGVAYLPEWEFRKRYDETFGNINPQKELIPFKKRIIYQTDSANCALHEFLTGSGSGCLPSVYMRLWQQYPQIENLVKNGCSKLLTQILAEATESKYYSANAVFNINYVKSVINLKKVKPADMLGITKQEFPIAKQCTLGEFLLYRYVKDERGIRLPMQYVKIELEMNARKARELLEQFPEMPVVHTINYLQKQIKKEETNNPRTNLVSPNYLRDYWNMRKAYYGEIPPELCFPKDLVKAHDEAVILQKEKEEKEITEKISRHAKIYEHYIFSDDELGLEIHPCRSQADLIREGKALSHCVSTYAKSVANGKTMIFFIRKIESPQKPFYTLEYRDGKVIQNRGQHNCAETKEVIEFKKRWLEKIKTVKRRKENGTDEPAGVAAS